jgi:hypothetical protein
MSTGLPAATQAEHGPCRRATAIPDVMAASEGPPVEVHGTISSQQGHLLTIATRTGEQITVDASRALNSGEATVLVSGRPVSILGTVGPNQEIRADVILREKAGPATWNADCAPPGVVPNAPR